jgi:TPR repeat protein
LNKERRAHDNYQQKKKSQQVCRAEQSTAEKEKLNKERRAHDNYQLARDEMDRDGDDAVVVNYLKAAARDGHVEAQLFLGQLYEDGELGLEKDDKAAFQMYRNAADGGSASAQFVLAVAYDLGDLGLEKDDKAALELYRNAAGSRNLNFGPNFLDPY